MTINPANLAKAETLTEALPYLQRYAGKTFVVKYGGHAMGDAVLRLLTARLREALDTLRAAVVAERDARCDSDDADEAAREAVNYDDEAEMVDAADAAAERWHKALATLNALLGPTTGGDR